MSAAWLITYMKLNILLLMVKGRGTMRSMNSAISATSRRKTCQGISAAVLRSGSYWGPEVQGSYETVIQRHRDVFVFPQKLSRCVVC